MTKPKAQLGFIGMGAMGQDLLRAAVANPRVELAAAADPDVASLNAAQGIAGVGHKSFEDYHELLACKLSGVIVATPQDTHRDICIACLEAGVPTFCEKPLALTVRDAALVVETASRRGVPLMIGHVFRYVQPWQAILEWASSGKFGRPIAARIVRAISGWSAWNRAWRLKRAASGGMLLEVSIHEIDWLCCLFGEASEVSALGGRYINHEVDYEDIVIANIAFSNGGIAHLASSCADFLGKHEAEIQFEEATIHFDKASGQVRIGHRDNEPGMLTLDELEDRPDAGIYRELDEFVSACLGEGEVTIPGEDGLRAVKVAEAIYQSVREGRPVSLPLRRER